MPAHPPDPGITATEHMRQLLELLPTSADRVLSREEHVLRELLHVVGALTEELIEQQRTIIVQSEKIARLERALWGRT